MRLGLFGVVLLVAFAVARRVIKDTVPNEPPLLWPTNQPLNVALLGDSVLDDEFWISHPVNDVRTQLDRRVKQINPQSQATNLAVDGFRVADVLQGSRAALEYRVGRWWNSLDPYPEGQDKKVHPLELLATAHPTHVLLSIGGNDARAYFRRGSDAEAIFNELNNHNFENQLDELVKRIQIIQSRVVFVAVYHPLILESKYSWWTSKAIRTFTGLPSEDVLTELLKKSAKFFSVARNNKIPVIDLSRTFDPYNPSDYGSSPIEPSEQGGEKIVDLFMKVLSDFRFGLDTSKIYSGVGNTTLVRDLDDSFSYETALDDFMSFCQDNAKARQKEEQRPE